MNNGQKHGQDQLMGPQYRLEPDLSKPFLQIPADQRERIRGRLAKLYGPERVEQVYSELERILIVHYAHATEELIAGDQLGSPHRLSERLLSYLDSSPELDPYLKQGLAQIVLSVVSSSSAWIFDLPRTVSWERVANRAPEIHQHLRDLAEQEREHFSRAGSRAQCTEGHVSCPLRPEPSATAAAISEHMHAAGLPAPAVRSFTWHIEAMLAGSPGLMRETDISPPEAVAEAGELVQHRRTGEQAMSRAVVIKLNDGLGTSMGLERAKSLLPVRADLSFLDLIARQIIHIRQQLGIELPLVLMDSLATDADTLEHLGRYKHLQVDGLPLSFLQHKIPKIREKDMAPVQHPQHPELEWCPPGHGDLFTALLTSGMLERLLARGIDLAFVSNADNLGAVVEPCILGHMIEHGHDLLMEVARRAPSDRKEGHLCRLRDGRLSLRESAQCPPADEQAFQDIDRYRYLDTTSLWIDLSALKRLLDEHGGSLPLPTIVNRKTVDPRDPSSTPVIQLETAMGSAISVFRNASAICVSRDRFSPVKTTSDLLAARSDAYTLTDDSRLALDHRRAAPPQIRLDSRYFKLVHQLERRFPFGPPSLIDCDSIDVLGNIHFGKEICVQGDVTVKADERPVSIPDHAVLATGLHTGWLEGRKAGSGWTAPSQVSTQEAPDASSLTGLCPEAYVPEA